MNNLKSVGLALIVSALASAGCDRAKEIKQQEDCRDKICEGDVVPRTLPSEFATKLGESWYAAPNEYGGFGNSFTFFWPSKVPQNSPKASAIRASGVEFYAIAIATISANNTDTEKAFGLSNDRSVSDKRTGR